MNIFRLASAALCGFLYSSQAAYAQCEMQRLSPTNDTIVLGTKRITLGEADDPIKPMSWVGPLKTEICTFDIGIIEEPIALAKNGLLFVTLYSGSQTWITILDLKTCSTRWTSPEFYGQAKFTSYELAMGPDNPISLNKQCMPVEPGKDGASGSGS
jgi:hypothetical protein